MSMEGMNRLPVPPEVKGYIAGMEDLMQDPRYNNAAVPQQVAMELIREGAVDSFAQFDYCLQELGSRVRFLAVPLDYFDDKPTTVLPTEQDGGMDDTDTTVDARGEVVKYDTVYPLGRSGDPEYTLYITVNGPGEAAQMLQSLGITPEENSARLQSAGVLTLPS